MQTYWLIGGVLAGSLAVPRLSGSSSAPARVSSRITTRSEAGGTGKRRPPSYFEMMDYREDSIEEELEKGRDETPYQRLRRWWRS